MATVSRSLPILLCVAVSLAGIGASIGAGKPSSDNSFVAVFPPWWSASRTLVAASEAGAILNSGTYSFVVLVQSNSPELGARLHAAGALLLLDPLGLGGCLQTTARNQNV